MLIFMDCEVFKHDWLCVFYNGKQFYRCENDRNALLSFMERHKNDLFIGYNIKNYDQYIIQAIIDGINPKLVNDYIIQGGAGWRLLKPNINIYDCMIMGKSLKQLESYLGVNIHETDVDFNTDRKLTPEELELNYKYCRDDVYNTALVFKHSQDRFKSQLGLCKLAGEPLSSMKKTQAQLSAKILKAKKLDDSYYGEEFQYEYVQAVKDYNYEHIEVLKFFDELRETKDDKAKFKIDIYGVPHVFALGGVHGAIPKYQCKPTDDEYILHIDVASYYPHLMSEWGLLSRAIPNPDEFKSIMELRLKYKREKNPLQAPLKVCINGLYGQSGALSFKNGRYQVLSPVADPRRMREVCINGQLLLLQLMEDLKQFDLIQSNTDGLIYKIRRDDFNELDRIVKAWEKRSRMTMEYDYTKLLVQKDVNNYIAVFDNGKVERKGAFVKESSTLDYDLPIVADTVTNYFTQGIEPEDYISSINELAPFMKTYKVSSKYDGALYKGEELHDKVYRVFASKDESDEPVYKFKAGGNPQLFAGCPKRCKIVNSDIRSIAVPDWLDKEWYINEAKKRIEKFLK